MKDFSRVIRCKADFYDCMRRNGWHLPAYKCGLLTEGYMVQVMEGRTYCPKIDEVRMRACPRPPQKCVLAEKFKKIISDRVL